MSFARIKVWTAAAAAAFQPPSHAITCPARDYDLEATLTSGQVFGWEQSGESWTGTVQGRWVRLRQAADVIHAQTAEPQVDWRWLRDYLQVDVNLNEVLATFPADRYLRAAIASCRGLRLLRQDPWECLASFILSSTKQISQIRQIVATLCTQFGTPVPAPRPQRAFSFPSAARLAAANEGELRACKMGFRAPYLLATAHQVSTKACDLEGLRGVSLAEARAQMLKLPGVGSKIADCVLLFAYGHPTAFPIDVWVSKALRQFYFRGRRVKPSRLRAFVEAYFGPQAGYAQQYLFHYVRTKGPGSRNK